MPRTEFKTQKTSGHEFYKLVRDLQADLLAAYRQMREDVLEIVQRGLDERWTPDEVEAEIIKLLE